MPRVMSVRPELHGSMTDVSGSIDILQSRHIPTQSMNSQKLVRIIVPLTENKKDVLRVVNMAMSYKPTLHYEIENGL